MIAELPHTVRHMFSVKRIGKCYAALCNRCSYRVNFMTFPLTALTHARMCRHVDYHTTFDDYVRRDGITPPSIAYDGPES
jgi:hypothetical protein